MYPWDRPATTEEIAEGNALYEAGWRGISQRHRIVALFEEAPYVAWLKKNPQKKEREEKYPKLRSSNIDLYLRCGGAPDKAIDFHPFRQVKRRENNWSQEALAMFKAVKEGDEETLLAMFPGKDEQ